MLPRSDRENKVILELLAASNTSWWFSVTPPVCQTSRQGRNSVCHRRWGASAALLKGQGQCGFCARPGNLVMQDGRSFLASFATEYRACLLH